MLPNRKLNSVRSESLDTGYMSLPQNSGRSSISINEETEQISVCDLKLCHKKGVSYSFINSDILYGDSFEVSSFTPFRNSSLVLRNLDKLVKLKLLSRFNQWKNNQSPNKTSKLFIMISIIHRIFSKRGKRVFSPPRVIKDADEIMTRTIKKIIQIKQRLFESAFIRWKYYKYAIYLKEKAVVFYRACQSAGHLFKDAFLIWKHKIMVRDSIKRTAATDKVSRVLNKAFRSRFRLFVFKTYLNMGPKRASGVFAALFLKKAQENKRLGTEKWKGFVMAVRGKNRQRRKDRKLVKLFRSWDKVLFRSLKKAWNLLRPVGDKKKLCRVVAVRMKLKRNQAWDCLKGLNGGDKKKGKGFKMQIVLMKVARKRQRAGFLGFLPGRVLEGSLGVFQELYRSRLRFALIEMRLYLSGSKVDEIKESTKFIRRNHRKIMLRTTKLAGKTMNFYCKNLLKRYFNAVISASEAQKSKQLSVKAASKYLAKKPKSFISKWKEFTSLRTNAIYRASLNSQRIQVIMQKVPLRTLKSFYSLIFERRSQVKVATRVFTRHMGKKPKSVLVRWQKTIEAIDQGLLLDACRSQKLKSSLNKVIQMGLKEVFFQLTSKPLNVSIQIKSIFKSFQIRLKQVFDRWRSSALQANFKKQFDDLRGKSLIAPIKNLIKSRSLLVFQSIAISQPRSLRLIRKSLSTFKSNLSKTLQTWRLSSLALKANSAKYKLSSIILRKKLGQVLQSKLQTYFQVFHSESNSKLTKLLGMYLFKLEDLPRKVFNVWRFFVLGCKTKTILDNRTCERIKKQLNCILHKTLRNTVLRILGNGRLVKGCFFKVNSLFSNRLRRVFGDWKKFTYFCSKHKLLDAFRRHQLKMTLNKMLSRTTFVTFHRIKGAGNFAKSVFKSMIIAKLRKVESCFNQWRSYQEVSKYKNSLMKNLVGFKLKSKLAQLIQLRVPVYLKQIFGLNSKKLKTSVRTFVFFVKGLERKCFYMWKNKATLLKLNEIRRKFNGVKVFQDFKRIEVRLSKDFLYKIVKGGDSLMRKFEKYFIRGLEMNFCKWRKLVGDRKLDLKRNEFNGLELMLGFFSIINRGLAMGFRRIIGSSDMRYKLKSVVKNYDKGLMRILHCWKDKSSQSFMKKVKQSHLKSSSLILKRLLETQCLNSQKSVFKNLISLQKKLNSLSKIKSTFIKNFKAHLLNFKTISSQIRSKSLQTAIRASCLFLSLKLPISRLKYFYIHTLIHSQCSLPSNPVKKFSLLWIQHYKQQLLSSWLGWVKFVDKCRQGKLLDACRSLNLRQHLENIHKATTRKTLDRVLGQGNQVRGYLRRMVFQIQKQQNSSFLAWKNLASEQRLAKIWKKFRASTLRSIAGRVSDKQLKTSFERIIGNGKRVLGHLMRVFSHFKYKYFRSFSGWKEKMLKLKGRDSERASKLFFAFSRAGHSYVRKVIEVITGDTRIRKGLNKLVVALRKTQLQVIQVLRARVDKIKTIKKINGSFIISKHVLSYLKRLVSFYYLTWKNLEYLRKRRLLRKSIGKIIQKMSINYESGFWKWKFVLTKCGKQLNPRHSIFFKRISAVASSYQTRLGQYALFKLVLNYKSQQSGHRVTLPKAIAKLIKDNEGEKTKAAEAVRCPESSEENGKISRVGALEVLFLQLQSVKLKKLSWVLSALDSNFRYSDGFDKERDLFKEKLAKLRYERQSLLDDNNTLRVHNDNLISSLEKNTDDLQQISLSLDYLKMNSMFRAIERVFIYNLLASFYKLNN